jgi:hypothetical protein
MLFRRKNDTHNSKSNLYNHVTQGKFSWFKGLLRKVARSSRLSKRPGVIDRGKKPDMPCVILPLKVVDKPRVITPPKKPGDHQDRPAFPSPCIVFSDTDNDINSVRNTLRFSGILNKKGEIKENLNGITILHTGDFIDKKNPDLSVVQYWEYLQQDASSKNWNLKLIVGNHEQEVWEKIRSGKEYGLDAKQSHLLNQFIESLDLFYIAGPVLFIHGYPTLEFLKVLLHYKETTGNDLNCFNTDHYKKAFGSINAIRQYAYARENRRTNYLLYDVADASHYYKKQGRIVGAVLAQLKIDIVVHGHRPQRSGVQVDYEFEKWIPGVRMIGNDTRVRRSGIGASVIWMSSPETLDTVFINAKTASKRLRKKVKNIVRSRPGSSGTLLHMKTEETDIKPVAQKLRG